MLHSTWCTRMIAPGMGPIPRDSSDPAAPLRRLQWFTTCSVLTTRSIDRSDGNQGGTTGAQP